MTLAHNPNTADILEQHLASSAREQHLIGRVRAHVSRASRARAAADGLWASVTAPRSCARIGSYSIRSSSCRWSLCTLLFILSHFET